MDELIGKLSQIFAASKIKTIGDLVEYRNLEDLENLPNTVRDQKIAPDVETISVLPNAAYEAMRNAGVQPDAITALVDEVVEFKMEMIEKAHSALTFD